MSQINILIRLFSSDFCLSSSAQLLSTNIPICLLAHSKPDGKAFVLQDRDNNRAGDCTRALSSCAIEKGALPSSSEVRSTHHRNTQEVARGQMVESEADHADSVASSVDELFPPVRKTN